MEVQHPLLQHHLGLFQNEQTPPYLFRQSIKWIATILALEAARELPSHKDSITTPTGQGSATFIQNPPLLISILRSGNAMVEVLMELFPKAHVGHIGIYRDTFIKNTVEYYFRIPPEHKGKEVYLLDPMIATGDTVISAIDRLTDYSVGQISVLTAMCSKKAYERIQNHCAKPKIFTGKLIENFSESGHLKPGPGDIGQRLYGPK